MYCNKLESLIGSEDSHDEDEIELLTLLIESWYVKNDSFQDLDPIEILHYLMEENHLKAKDLVEILNLSKGTVSKTLNYHKGLSKNSIRVVAHYFKVSQEIFNRPYALKIDNKTITV
jgi:HTH-type transcriptional regulator/antitoxin HigA